LPFGLRDSVRFPHLDVINQVDFRAFKCGNEWMQCREVI